MALSTKNQSNQSINLSKRFLSYLDLNVLDEGYSRNTPSLIYMLYTFIIFLTEFDYMSKTLGISIRSMNCLQFASTWTHSYISVVTLWLIFLFICGCFFVVFFAFVLSFCCLCTNVPHLLSFVCFFFFICLFCFVFVLSFCCLCTNVPHLLSFVLFFVL